VPGKLEPLTTYYWRVDEIAADGSTQTGEVWRFTTYLVVDDFESYNDLDNFLSHTWIDGWTNGTGSCVGCDLWWGNRRIVHGGLEAMPFEYNNVDPPYYSEACRVWDVPQDWAIHGIDTLTLHVRGRAANKAESLYVAIEDRTGKNAVVTYLDPALLTKAQWAEWKISLADFTGIDTAAVKKMYIGVGSRENPQPGGIGLIYIDDICLTKRTP